MTSAERTLQSIQNLEAKFAGQPDLQRKLIELIDLLPPHVRDRRTDFQLKQIRGRLDIFEVGGQAVDSLIGRVSAKRVIMHVDEQLEEGAWLRVTDWYLRAGATSVQFVRSPGSLPGV